MSFWTKWTTGIGDANLWKLIGPAIKDLALLLPREVVFAGIEWVKQADTQDGWTGQEKRAYVITRLQEIQKAQIGDVATDAVFDMLIAAIVRNLQKGLINPTPTNPIPPAEKDPYYRPLKFDPTQVPGLLSKGDRVFFNALMNLWYVQKFGAKTVELPRNYVLLMTVA